MMPPGIPRSVRLQCSLAAAITNPASLVASDLQGLSPWDPDRLKPFRDGPNGDLVARALAADLGLHDLAAGDSLAVGLRTKEDVRLALQIAIAPASELRAGVRQLAAATFRKTIGNAVRKADRMMLSEHVGEEALLTATRQAETFWPSLSVYDTLDPGLLAAPQEPAQAHGEAAAAWSRPRLSREIALLPAILRQAWGILHACVDATDKTSGAMLRARFGAGLADLLPAGGLRGPAAAARSIPAPQCAVIFNLLQRKVPAWSTSID
ncbi:hypothetical protein [Aquibium microcysteis]|uniref:hypothetical protein n=1 Tax=Aquibium microcysteis TaxID=675281 RepID=UPI00165D2630|nr:hypothetical protein [Aquibium microcysteis]